MGVKPGSNLESKTPKGGVSQSSQTRVRCICQVVNLDPSSATNVVGTGHFVRSCTHTPPRSEVPGQYTSQVPGRHAASKNEPSGRGPSARTATLTANPSSAGFTVEETLAKCQLERENLLLRHTSTSSEIHVDMVTCRQVRVGRTLLLAIQIGRYRVSVNNHFPSGVARHREASPQPREATTSVGEAVG